MVILAEVEEGWGGGLRVDEEVAVDGGVVEMLETTEETVERSTVFGERDVSVWRKTGQGPRIILLLSGSSSSPGSRSPWMSKSP